MYYSDLKAYLDSHPHSWLVTGCAGFIGSNLLETLLDLNQKIIGLDNFSTGYQKNLDEVLSKFPSEKQENFYFIKGDIRSLKDCRNAVKDVEYVLHQAALGSVPRSIKTPALTHSVNVDGFVNMLITARDSGVKRFVYASSSAVYGDSPNLPKLEKQVGQPQSPYAVSKYVNELYANVFGKHYDIQTIGLRYFNVFGPRQDPKGAYAAVIPLWISSLLKGASIFINGDGETSRDFCYIQNVVQANLLATFSRNSEAHNRTYNVAVGERTTLNQLLKMLSEALNIKPKKIEYHNFRPGDIPHSLADISLAKNLLEYSPTHHLKQGIFESIDWYRHYWNGKV